MFPTAECTFRSGECTYRSGERTFRSAEYKSYTLGDNIQNPCSDNIILLNGYTFIMCNMENSF